MRIRYSLLDLFFPPFQRLKSFICVALYFIRYVIFSQLQPLLLFVHQFSSSLSSLPSSPPFCITAFLSFPLSFSFYFGKSSHMLVFPFIGFFNTQHEREEEKKYTIPLLSLSLPPFLPLLLLSFRLLILPPSYSQRRPVLSAKLVFISLLSSDSCLAWSLLIHLQEEGAVWGGRKGIHRHIAR